VVLFFPASLGPLPLDPKKGHRTEGTLAGALASIARKGHHLRSAGLSYPEGTEERARKGLERKVLFLEKFVLGEQPRRCTPGD
jgi:hypothetical protein